MTNPLSRLVDTPAEVATLEKIVDRTANRAPTATRIGFQFNDGGRGAAGYKGLTGDCGVRALAICHYGAGLDDKPNRLRYEEARLLVLMYAKDERITKRRKTRSSIQKGIHKATMRRIMAALGWQWRPCMAIGGGCTTHLRADELPPGRLIVCVSKHFTAVIDGVVHDTYCDDRDGTRCVYGYWWKP